VIWLFFIDRLNEVVVTSWIDVILHVSLSLLSFLHVSPCGVTNIMNWHALDFINII
jgi:hypothetical protein